MNNAETTHTRDLNSTLGSRPSLSGRALYIMCGICKQLTESTSTTSIFFLFTDNLTTSHEVLTFDGSTDHINLTCEMSFYIWPDQNLIWIRDDDNVTIQESEKYYISFGNGSELVAQNGGNQHSPSRISTLTIHDPTHCDSSTYSCVLVGTPDSKSLSITLEVPQTDDGMHTDG